MNEWVIDADLYVTMHTGTWILAYPWGFTGEMPSDRELFEYIRDTIHDEIDSELPVRNANAGIYPTHGTSRDYGYGVMGYPTFTFETDDEQFLLGTFESLSDRLSVELEVMRYLISNVWYWRARLDVESLEISGHTAEAQVVNSGQASTENATIHYLNSDGEVLWHSEPFLVNASNQTLVSLDATNLTMVPDGSWAIHYQKRVIDSSIWVEETIDNSVVNSKSGSTGFLPAPSILLGIIAIFAGAINQRKNDIFVIK
jgi:hypothetical protein